MKVLVVHAGETYENEALDDDYIDSTMNQAMVHAYFPNKKAPEGIYEIFIVIYGIFKKSQKELKIGVINYNHQETGKWIINKKSSFFDLYPEGEGQIPSFKIITKFSNEDNSKTTASSTEQFTDGWRFVVYFKNRDENPDGSMEDPNLYDNVSDDFCSEFVHSTGNEKTAGAVCPTDPYTNKTLEMCLNSNRKDIIGKMCAAKKKFSIEFLQNLKYRFIYLLV